MYHPPRGGVRGGRILKQFITSDVKTDKYRENYLGHSVHAPVGRWQQGKDLTWYAKDGTPIRPEKEEIDKVKAAESELMASMLGAKKRSKVSQSAQEGVDETQKTDETVKEQEDDEMTNEEISRRQAKGDGKTKSRDVRTRERREEKGKRVLNVSSPLGVTTNPHVVEVKIEMMTAIAGHLDAVQVMKIDSDDGLPENHVV
ncbi:9087_t:CDS:2 [Paraglomus brasilianum]|uniref:9087_t:CDS:1 n=1 Tax=Paraglomus brasilianum TaxID=144538 RepID=A0A9N8VW54_9GLOM|nr:9087_t:CDS:2 [Paraglomus brasilianum]